MFTMSSGLCQKQADSFSITSWILCYLFNLYNNFVHFIACGSEETSMQHVCEQFSRKKIYMQVLEYNIFSSRLGVQQQAVWKNRKCLKIQVRGACTMIYFFYTFFSLCTSSKHFPGNILMWPIISFCKQRRGIVCELWAQYVSYCLLRNRKREIFM